MSNEFRGISDKEARVEKMAGNQQPPLSGRVAGQKPVPAKHEREEDEKTEFKK
jgi:hypothetical protein